MIAYSLYSNNKKNMINKLFVIITVFQYSFSFGQEIIFEENFDNNSKGWTVKNEWNRESNISNGLLTDYFSGDGYQTTNIIAANFDKSNDYCITVKIANLNNLKGYSYYTFKKMPNGITKKVNEVVHPSFKITIGFKDWDNYHAIEFQTSESSYGSRELSYRSYSVINGETIIHDDWSSINTASMDNNAGFNTISIKKNSDGYSIYRGEYSYISDINFNRYLGKISLSEWYGDYFGFIIPAGTKIGVDFIKVTKKEKSISTTSNFNMEYTDIRTMVEKISEKQDSVDIWINTSSDGKRMIHIEDIRVSGLQNDEYYFCLKFSKLVFEYMFSWINYSKEKPITYKDLAHAMEIKSIIGIEFKTKSRTHTFNWEKITTE